jgi:hypothetical protein
MPEHPTHRLKPEPLSLTEKATFGHDAVRDPESGRVFQQGEGALPREQQALLFAAEAKKGGPLSNFEAQMVLQQVRAGK